MPGRRCSTRAFCTCGSPIPFCTFSPVRGFRRIQRPSDGPCWICTQMSLSRGTSFGLAQLRKSPITGTWRNLASEGANRKSRFARRLLGSAILFLHKETSEEQSVHARAEKRTDRVGGRVHDGFAAQVEGRVHDDGHAGALAEFIDQAVVERIDFFFDGLRARAAVHVSDGGDGAA